MNLGDYDKDSASELSAETHFSFLSLDTNLIASRSKHSPTIVAAPYVM